MLIYALGYKTIEEFDTQWNAMMNNKINSSLSSRSMDSRNDNQIKQIKQINQIKQLNK